jgi:regulator of sigma E protease
MILSILFTILTFAVTISVLVAIHEGGHFLVAKWVRVWVHEFAIGFGPAVWKRKWGETLYAIRLLPLGGYVRMAGEDAGSEEDANVPPDRLFAAKPAWAKIAVILAGPAANILAAVVLMIAYAALFGTPYVEIAEVAPESPAWGQLRSGDKLVRLEGEAIYLPEQIPSIVQGAQGRPLEAVILRGDERLRVTLTPYWSERQGRYLIGISFAFPLPEIAFVPESSSWAAQGLRAGDVVLSVGGQAIGSWAEAVHALSQALEAARPIELKVLRDGQLVALRLDPRGLKREELDEIRPQLLWGQPTFPIVERVEPSSPLRRAGLQPGDRLTAADGEAIVSAYNLVKAFFHAQALGRDELQLQVIRGQGRLTLTVPIAELDLQAFLKGLQLQLAKRKPEGVWASFAIGLVNVRNTFLALYMAVKQIFAGQVSPGEAVTGPVGIASIVGRSLQQGFETFFRVVALLSLILGITNLIPFPALDGSRVLFIVINAALKTLTGWSIPPEKEGWVHYIGFLLLMALIVLITWNDIHRLLQGGF